MPLDQIDTPPARRQLLRQAGLGAVMLGAMGAGLKAVEPSPATAAGITDADILNFALNLEYLEAEYYLIGVNGTGLQPSQTGGVGGPAGPVTGGSYVPSSGGSLRRIFTDIASDEHAHVLFLRAALGAAAVARPAIDFRMAFTTIARAAGIVGPTGTFNPFQDEASFLLGAYVFEDVGVTAYHGAAPLIVNKDYLAAAAGIMGTEAYHAGAVRILLSQMGGSLLAAAEKVSALRAALSQAPDDSGPTGTPSQINLVPSDANSEVFSRTTTQVLDIVYGNTSTTPGLFYPRGMNGAIR